MLSASPDPAALRRLLATRFPGAHTWGESTAPPPAPAFATGLPAIDDATGGGLPLGALTEIVCPAPSCGGQLLLGQLLAAARRAHRRVALVDAFDTFDPASFGDDALAHLVWVRGHGDLPAALSATDLLARDGNLGLVLLDVRAASLAALRRSPAPLWYRLQRAAETAQLPLVVHSPRAFVPSARLRLELNQQRHTLADLATARPSLAMALAPTLRRQRLNLVTGSG